MLFHFMTYNPRLNCNENVPQDISTNYADIKTTLTLIFMEFYTAVIIEINTTNYNNTDIFYLCIYKDGVKT